MTTTSLQVRNYHTDELVHTIDVRGKTESQVERIMLGMLNQIPFASMKLTMITSSATVSHLPRTTTSRKQINGYYYSSTDRLA